MIVKEAVCGSLESGDCFVRIEPAKEISINIESIVFDEFSELIENAIRKTLKELNVENCKISINDKGALDYVIAARIETVVKRASD